MSLFRRMREIALQALGKEEIVPRAAGSSFELHERAMLQRKLELMTKFHMHIAGIGELPQWEKNLAMLAEDIEDTV